MTTQPMRLFVFIVRGQLFEGVLTDSLDKALLPIARKVALNVKSL